MSYKTMAAGGRFLTNATAAFVTAGLLLTSCITSPAWSQGQITTEPIPQDRIDAAIAQLDELAATVLDQTGIPGLAIAVVQNGETVFTGGYGMREIGKDEAIDANTVFQIASLSKSLASTVVARQVGEGIVAWDTPVETYLPWFKLHDEWVSAHATIGDFFAHRSGLPDHAGDDLEDLGYDRREILERLRFVPLHGFRDTYAYTNFGLTAAAEAVATASGVDWAALSDHVLYTPLGMTSTSSRFDDFMAADNRAVGHAFVAGEFSPVRLRMPDAQSPAGGVSSTVTDFARWMIMVLSDGRFGDEAIIDERALLPAITPEMISRPSTSPADQPGFYGFGFGVNTQPSGLTALSHSGAFVLGAGSNYMMLPSEGLGIVALSNATPMGAVETLNMQFMDLVQYGEIQRDWVTLFGGLYAEMIAPLGDLSGATPPVDPVPPAELSAYQGVYGNDYLGPAIVELKEDHLSLILGPEGQTFALEHWSGNQFYFPVFNENMPDGSVSSISFELGASGEADSVVIEYLDEYGLGRFDRQ